MQLKQILLASLIVSSLSAQADVKLEDNSLIKGKWNLYAESIALHKEKVSLQSMWEFKGGGILHTKSEDRRGRTKTLIIDLKYSVEDGVIKKQVSPGRSKTEDCRVVKLDRDNMTLKCKFVFFFLKR